MTEPSAAGQRGHSSLARALTSFGGFELFWNVGWTLVSPGIVLPAFLAAAGGPMTAIALVPVIGTLVGIVAQPLSIALFGRLRHRRYASIGALTGAILAVGGLAAVVLLAPPGRFAAIAVGATLGAAALMQLFATMNSPLFYSLMVDCVLPRDRGPLVGSRQVFIALGTLAAALVSGPILASAAFPTGFGRLFAVAAGVSACGPAFFFLLREPARARSRAGASRNLRAMLRRLAQIRGFPGLVVGLSLLWAATGAGGLVVGHLSRRAGGAVAGTILLSAAISRLAAGPLCGYWASRRGFQVTAWVAAAVLPVGAFGVILLPSDSAAVLWGACTGIALATLEMWAMNLPAELFPEEDRAGLFALLAVLVAPMGSGLPILLGFALDRGVSTTAVLAAVAALAPVGAIVLSRAGRQVTARPTQGSDVSAWAIR